MNLYKFYRNPNQLDGYEEAQEIIPIVIWEKYKDNPDKLKKREKYISKSPKYAYLYARDILKGSFPLGEQAIAKSPNYAYLYAKDILKGPFPEGEKVIATEAWYAYLYAMFVLKGPFELGEKTIITSKYKDDYLEFLGNKYKL